MKFSSIFFLTFFLHQNLLLGDLNTIAANNSKITHNQLDVIEQLESIGTPTLEEALIISQLQLLSLEELQHSLNQMSGEQYTTLVIATEISGNKFIRSLYNPIRSTVVTPACPYTTCCEPNFGVWVQGSGGQAFINNCKHAKNTIANGYEVSAGAHKICDRDWTIGIAGSFGEDWLDYKEDGKGKMQYAFGGLYGLYRPINYYVFVNLAAGASRTDFQRNIAINGLHYTAFSKPKSIQGVGYIEAGMDCTLWDLMVQPFLGFEGNIINNRFIEESGFSPLNLTIDKKVSGNLYSRLGAHITIDQCYYLVSLDLVWKYRLNPSHHRITAQFQLFGDDFRIKDVKRGQDYFEGALSVNSKLWECFELFAEASGFVGYHSSAYTILGGMKYSW